MNRRIFLLFIVGILLVGFVSANYCCEKTEGGAWCQSIEDKDDCVAQVSETSCESTTYCKTGCCFNSLDGTCSQNTAQKTCDNNNGVWRENTKCQIPECEYGCCVLSNQGVWGTRTKCSFMASSYGIGIDFRSNVESEFDCNLIGSEEDIGACVYEENVKTCSFITRAECNNVKNASFYKDYLCSAKASKEISNICERSKKTTCSDGKVYFVDTCGNLANVYDAAKVDKQAYWEKVVDSVSCDDGAGNVNSDNCGLCEYYAGSTCGIKRTGDASPKHGDYLCRDLSCTYEGVTYQHGERWCATESHGNKGVTNNLPGSENFVLSCDNGKVTPFGCGGWRKKICTETEIGGIRNAQCIMNDYTDCLKQDNKKDCEDEERRDCLWVEDAFKTTWSSLKCIPKYPVGTNFWEDSSNSGCEVGTAECTVTYEKGATTKFGWEPVHNKYCLSEEWKNKMNEVCMSLGDCGSSVNYFGQEGWYEIDDLWSKS